MRILNQDTDKSVENLLILLTSEEAIEFRDMLDQLISRNKNQDQAHEHLTDSEYNREITIAIYKPNDYHLFDERTQQLILKG
jgi:hypothetical protein